MRSREKQSGSILLVLIVGALAAMLAVIVAGLSLNQLALSKQSTSRGLYQLAGDSVAALALSELQVDPTFGQTGHPQRSRLFRWTGPEGEEKCAGRVDLAGPIGEEGGGGLGGVDDDRQRMQRRRQLRGSPKPPQAQNGC